MSSTIIEVQLDLVTTDSRIMTSRWLAFRLLYSGPTAIAFLESRGEHLDPSFTTGDEVLGARNEGSPTILRVHENRHCMRGPWVLYS